MKKLKFSWRRNYAKLMVGIIFCIVSVTIYNCTDANAKAKNEASYTKLTTNVTIDGYPNFFGANASQVPHDVDSPADSTQTALSIFAWKEFIALNWPSSYNTTTHERGKPDPNATVNDFLNSKNNGQLVWQTYKHRVEIFPEDTSNYNKNFHTAPKYFYKNIITGVNSSTKLRDIDTIFNNLDETSEINLATLFVDADPDSPGAGNYPNAGTASGLPGAPRRMIYEAKANEDMFKYVVSKGLYDTVTRNRMRDTTKLYITKKGKGAVYPPPSPTKHPDFIAFPFGDKNGTTEGSIEIKATWRQLTLKEYKSGRFLTSPIVYYRNGKPGDKNPDGTAYYETVPAVPTYDNSNNLVSLPYGLVGLHIIHKTETFPSYVFATFEQVDNLNRSIEHNKLFYYNRNVNPFNPDTIRQNVTLRFPDILPETDSVNAHVHKQIKSLNNNSVWQYYKLIGVQGHPTNSPVGNDFYLANIVTETNDVLANFTGTLNNFTGAKNANAINLYQGDKKFNQGGCKGCHGNAQITDFSFITLNSPFDGVPDFINQPLRKTDDQ